MSFEDFYEESDKSRRRWWKCFGAAFLLFIGYWTFALFSLPDFKSDRNLNETFKTKDFNKAERTRRADDLCRYLPLPEQFFFIEKDSPKHFKDSTSIVYRYTSDRQPEEIIPFFLIWFKDNGWKSIADDGTWFRKDQQIVSIRLSEPYEITPPKGMMMHYEIQCSESDY